MILYLAVPRFDSLHAGDGVVGLRVPLGVKVLPVLVVGPVLHTVPLGDLRGPLFGKLVKLERQRVSLKIGLEPLKC